VQAATEYSLKDVYDSDEYGDKIEVLYEYDMGDGWEHNILFLGKERSGLWGRGMSGLFILGATYFYSFVK
jgi:hypothetical protein